MWCTAGSVRTLWGHWLLIPPVHPAWVTPAWEGCPLHVGAAQLCPSGWRGGACSSHGNNGCGQGVLGCKHCVQCFLKHRPANSFNPREVAVLQEEASLRQLQVAVESLTPDLVTLGPVSLPRITGVCEVPSQSPELLHHLHQAWSGRCQFLETDGSEQAWRVQAFSADAPLR